MPLFAPSSLTHARVRPKAALLSSCHLVAYVWARAPLPMRAHTRGRPRMYASIARLLCSHRVSTVDVRTTAPAHGATLTAAGGARRPRPGHGPWPRDSARGWGERVRAAHGAFVRSCLTDTSARSNNSETLARCAIGTAPRRVRAYSAVRGTQTEASMMCEECVRAREAQSAAAVRAYGLASTVM